MISLTHYQFIVVFLLLPLLINPHIQHIPNPHIVVIIIDIRTTNTIMLLFQHAQIQIHNQLLYLLLIPYTLNHKILSSTQTTISTQVYILYA